MAVVLANREVKTEAIPYLEAAEKCYTNIIDLCEKVDKEDMNKSLTKLTTDLDLSKLDLLLLARQRKSLDLISFPG